MKLWEKGSLQLDALVERFTTGHDRELDVHLALYDVRASIAHATMLGEVGILTADEARQLCTELERIAERIERGEFRIEDGVEDVHSQLELELTRALGSLGEKIHTARSRNDQVLTALALYVRDRLQRSLRECVQLAHVMLEWSRRYAGVLLPGMTHLQAAMPTTFGLWMAAFAESLVQDFAFGAAALELASINPLGTAAGYGTRFPINRARTAELLGFRSSVASPPAAQLLRVKLERSVATLLAALAATLGRFASDVVLFLSPGFRFLRLPESLTTGSSIMPHKQNPDVFELVRARCATLQLLPTQIAALTLQLPSGYHRDYQLTKELLLPAWDAFDACVEIALHVVPYIEPLDGILERPEYRDIWSVEWIAERMRSTGESFRSAYRAIGTMLLSGELPETNRAELIAHVHAHLHAETLRACEAIERELQRTASCLAP